jgi:hypothetical protein
MYYLSLHLGNVNVRSPTNHRRPLTTRLFFNVEIAHTPHKKTVCKTCIFKHFVDSNQCPHCDCDLGSTPLEKIRHDRALQSIVDKVFPQFATQEKPAKLAFEGSAIAGNDDHKRKAAASDDAPPAKRAVEKLSFSLTPVPGCKATAKKLEKPFFRAPTALSVQHFVDRILGPRLGEPANTLEVLCQGKVVNDMTLLKVHQLMWNNPDKELSLSFRVK